MRVLVIGAGAWGTAVAVHAARRHPVHLLCRREEDAQALASERRNRRYLPEALLAPSITVGADLGAALVWLRASAPGESADGGLLVIGTAVAGLRPTLEAIGPHPAWRGSATPVVWLCKGLERETGLLPHQVAASLAVPVPGAPVSGPSFAQEVAAGLPVALTVGADDDTLADRVVGALHHGSARIYRSDDPTGVEVGGALKNVMAIAAGICDGLSLGHNARAALITRGLAEIARFGTAIGARAETFMGLTGLGDLVLTCTGDLSRNRRVGLALAQGRALADVVAELGHVAEGVPCTEAVVRQARLAGVDVPIATAVQTVLAGHTSAREAVLSLLAREPKRE